MEFIVNHIINIFLYTNLNNMNQLLKPLTIDTLIDEN
jgi:hypothetical protein